jgi:protein TonB
MSLQAIKPDPDPQLAVALLVSAVLHVVVLLGVGFLAPETNEPGGETLTMVDYLPQSDGQETPADPEARSASRSQQARGTDSERREASAPDAGRTPAPKQPAASPAPAPETQTPSPTPAAPTEPGAAEAERRPVLSAEESEESVAAPAKGGEGEPRDATEGPDAGSFQLFPSDRQVARWDNERRAAKAAADRPGKARTATREEAVAAYTTSLLNKVQRIGNMNYPEEARERGITGKVRLELRIRPDGTLAGVSVLESSGSDILDAGAKQIIRLAAPFSPFPQDMKRNHPESYSVSHYLNFTRGGDLAGSGG